MGKSKKPKVARLPDLNALSDKSYAMNKESLAEQTLANRPDQNNPFGSINWTKDPTTGEWTQNTTYNPQQQALLDQQVANQGAIGGMAGDLAGQIDMTYGGAPKMPGVADYSGVNKMPGVVDYSSLGDIPKVGGYNQQVIDTINALQQPGMDRARASKEAQLAAMGIGTGTGSAWNTEQGNLGDTENRARMNAILAGIQQGNTEFGQGMQAYGQGATNLNNQFAQGMLGRQQGVNELNNQFTQGMQARQQGVQEENNRVDALRGLMGLSSPAGLQFGNFSQQGVVSAPDYVTNALATQQNQQAINNAKASSSGGLGGIFGGIAGSVLGSAAGPIGSSIGSSIGKSIFG
jgi:hypothetical protein